MVFDASGAEPRDIISVCGRYLTCERLGPIRS